MGVLLQILRALSSIAEANQAMIGATFSSLISFPAKNHTPPYLLNI